MSGEEEGSTLTEQDVYIIAGVCGVIIVTLLIILVIFICRRRRNQNKYEETKPVTTEIRAQPVNGVQQSPRKTQVYDNQDGPLDLKRNQGNGFLPNGHATANGSIPHDTSYDSQIDKRVFENEMNRRNEYSTRVDFNNRQGGDLHFHGIPNSSSKDKYLDLEEKKEGSLESGYSTPDPAKPKKFFKLKHRHHNDAVYSDFSRYSHNPPGHTCGLPCCREDVQIELLEQTKARGIIPGCMPAQVKYSEPNFTLRTKRNLIKGRPTFANKFLSLQPGNLVANHKQRPILPEFHDDIMIGTCYSNVQQDQKPQVSEWDHFYRKDFAIPELPEDKDHFILLNHGGLDTCEDLDHNEIGTVEVHIVPIFEEGNIIKPLRFPIVAKDIEPQTHQLEIISDKLVSKESLESPVDEGYSAGSVSDKQTDSSDSDYMSSDHYYDIILPVPLPTQQEEKMPKSCLKKRQISNSYQLPEKFSTLPKHFFSDKSRRYATKSVVPHLPPVQRLFHTDCDESSVWTVPTDASEEIYEDIVFVDDNTHPEIVCDASKRFNDIKYNVTQSPIRKRSDSVNIESIPRTGSFRNKKSLRKKVSFALSNLIHGVTLTDSQNRNVYQTYTKNDPPIAWTDLNKLDDKNIKLSNLVKSEDSKIISSETKTQQLHDTETVNNFNLKKEAFASQDLSSLVKSPVTLIL